MFGYKVDIEQYCDHNERSDEDYGSWSSSFTNSLSDIVRKTNEYPDIVSSLDIAPGTRALVVWAVWSTGDSFGHSSGSGTEAFGIFTDLKSAEELQKAMEDYSSGNRKDDIVVTTSDGQVFKLGYMPWFGYFDSLDSVRIDAVSVF